MDEIKICPVMAKGWLSNKYAAKSAGGGFSDQSPSWDFNNLPKCLKEKCAMWCFHLNKCSYRGDN